MQLLLSEATYRGLLDLRGKMVGDGLGPLGGVMMPAGALEGDGPRVLWVGQALRGGNTDESSWAAENYAAWVPSLLTKPWPFWRFIRRTMTEALRRHNPGAAVGTDDLLQHIGWANLALIEAGSQANPMGRALKEQIDPCAAALREAITRMRPTAVVAVVGEYAPEILKRGAEVPAGRWEDVDPTVTPLEVVTRSDGLRVFWTHHPNFLNYRGRFSAVSSRLAQEL